MLRHFAMGQASERYPEGYNNSWNFEAVDASCAVLVGAWLDEIMKHKRLGIRPWSIRTVS